jgi:hypothetical protein
MNARNDKDRCMEYNILKNQAPDLISSKNAAFTKHVAKWDDNQSLACMKGSLNEIKTFLNDAENIYASLRETLTGSCTETSCAEVVSLGQKLTLKLGLIEPQIDKIAPKENSKTGEK